MVRFGQVGWVTNLTSQYLGKKIEAEPDQLIDKFSSFGLGELSLGRTGRVRYERCKFKKN